MVDHAPLILVGYNGTPHGDRALAYAVGQATRMGAELLLMVAGEDPALWPTHAARRTRRIRALLARAEEQLAGLGTRWRLGISDAEPTQALSDSAHRYHADLIVVGSSGKGWHRLFSDRVGCSLARTTHTPFLIAP
ncbi:universal stress protein [Streptantibioticus rubrisoli]|uniref:Universal stress protein n=1 Tax=Streptantibioticus rubrisoli TaxID=1387313 RepID=A0ABT1PHC8_9ACTN|nr:universal stress protein [Streptantibioticus rubrisoli]MCQ4044764.1 universal stress protein [Streptantibioticus rubrisoli]